MRLKGRRVLIVGAGPRSGRAMAVLFAQEGARVVLSARSAEPLEEVVEAVRSRGGQAWALPADATDPGAVEQVARTAAERLQGLDGLVHSVGGGFYALDRRLHELEPGQWEDILSRTLTSAYHACRAAIPHLLASGGGSIVLLSASPRVRLLGSVAYAAAKAGVVELGRKMAREYRPSGIRVNALSPGMVRQHPVPTDPIQTVSEALPRDGRERQGEAADVAFAALYLLSQESAWVTGAELVVDGGFSLHSAPEATA